MDRWRLGEGRDKGGWVMVWSLTLVIIEIEADREGDCCECKMEQEQVEWIV